MIGGRGVFKGTSSWCFAAGWIRLLGWLFDRGGDSWGCYTFMVRGVGKEI